MSAANQEQFIVRILRHESDLRAFIGSLVQDRDSREDTFQDCALMLLKQYDRFDETKSFGAWARGIAANLILQRWHQDKRFPVAFSPETIQAVQDAYDRTEQTASLRADALTECLKGLPGHSRELLVQRYELELKPIEIASKTGQSIDAIYQALSRIRAKLETCIIHKVATAEILYTNGDM